MNCNNVRELILTDFSDNELSPDKQKMLETHLATCLACRNLAAGIKECSGVLSGAERISLDRDKIWQRIVAEIDAEKTSSVIYEPVRGVSVWEKLFAAVKPAYVLASLGLVILLTSFVVRRPPVVTVQLQEKEEEVQYLAYVIDQFAADESEGDNLGTSIEEYFL